MRTREIPFNNRVPSRIQFKTPKIKQILSFYGLKNPSVREDKEHNRLVFRVDTSGNPITITAAIDEIEAFLGEPVLIMDRSFQYPDITTPQPSNDQQA